MTAVISIFRLASLFLALLTLPTADADKVIPRGCGPRGLGFRDRHYPTDLDATILIAECQLTAVGTDDFNGLPYLIVIDLEHNDISHVHPAAFKSVPRLKWLNLNRNKLIELPAFNENSCPSLITLDMSENLLTVLTNRTALSACKNLEKIDLSKNNIEFLHSDLFTHLTELRDLRLNNNKTVYVEDSFLAGSSKLEWLAVQNNKLDHFPYNLKSLKHIELDGNPWLCSCLLELLKDVKRAGVNYESWIFNGFRPKCVYIGNINMYPCYPYPQYLSRSAPSLRW